MESPSPPWHIPRAVSSPSEAVAASLFCKPELVPFLWCVCPPNNCTGEHHRTLLAQPLWWDHPQNHRRSWVLRQEMLPEIWGHPLCLARQGWQGAGVTCHWWLVGPRTPRINAAGWGGFGSFGGCSEVGVLLGFF